MKHDPPQQVQQGRGIPEGRGGQPVVGRGSAHNALARKLSLPGDILRSGNDVELIATIALAAAVILWLVALPQMNADQLNNFGLVSILPAAYWFALACITGSFFLSLDTSCRWAVLRPTAVVVLILLLHATPPIIYETLRYSWAWKHIGIVDYIQRHGEVDRTAPFLAAYHNWPLFFWLTAKLSNALDLTSLQIANIVRFFPFFSSLGYAGLLYAIYRRFSHDFRLVWAAVWVFVCTNWVGQDYFSPQAFAFFLYLLVLAICLGPLLRPVSMPRKGLARRWYRLRTHLTRGAPKFPAVGPWMHALAAVTVCLAIWEIVAAHQLTPLILLNALLVLWVFAGLSPAYAAFTALAVASWLVFPAAPFTALELPEQVSGVMKAWNGLTEKFVDTSVVDPQVAAVAWGGRILTLAAAMLAGFGWLRRFRSGGRDGTAVGLLVAPLPIVFFTSYGGEVIFRIYLFCIPFLAFFVAALFFPTNGAGRGLGTRFLFAGAAFLMAAGFLLGNNGKDRQYRFSPEEVAGASWLYQNAEPGTLLVEGARNYPSQFMNYEHFTYVPLANESREAQNELLVDPARTLSRWLRDDRWKNGYVILTRSQKAYVDALGKMPDGALERIEFELQSSADFRLVYVNRDVRIYTLSSLVGRR